MGGERLEVVLNFELFIFQIVLLPFIEQIIQNSQLKTTPCSLWFSISKLFRFPLTNHSTMRKKNIFCVTAKQRKRSKIKNASARLILYSGVLSASAFTFPNRKKARLSI